MKRALFAMAAVSIAWFAGCGRAPDTAKEQHPAERQGGIKVHAPGVDVEIEKGPKKKGDVDVHSNR